MRRVILSLIAFECPAVLESTGLAQAPPPPTPPRPVLNYSSPAAVFDAYREAIAKNDTRTVILCQVPGHRGDAYQAFICSEMVANKPKVVAVLKKFGADAITPEYVKQFKLKYGMDLETAAQEYTAKAEKLLADYYKARGADAPYPEKLIKELRPQPTDQELLRKIVTQKISDQLSFVVELEDAARNADSEPRFLGVLKNLRVNGDTAVGDTTQSSYHLTSDGAGMPNRKVIDVSPCKILFHKTKDGWLVVGTSYNEGPLTPPVATPVPPRR